VSESRRSAIGIAFGVFAAMLVVPLLAWLLLPTPAPPPPHAKRPKPTVVEAAPETPQARPTEAPRPAARPAATTKEDAPVEDAVVGMVVDPDGQPVAGAFVGCDDRNTNLSASTGEDGRFRLPAEASGCLVLAHHAQHPASERVRVEIGKENLVRLGKGGSIEGVVVDDSGAAITSYRLSVELFLPKAEGIELGVRGRPLQIDDPTGSYVWDRLPAGRYVLGASAQGHPAGKSDSVTVEPGQTTRNVRIVLPRGATLTGSVLDAETRQPIMGAVVRMDGMSGAGPDPILPATTDNSGTYMLVGVPPGPFSVRVERDGYRARIVSGLTTKGASSFREDITLKPRGDGGAESELEGIGAVLVPGPQGLVIASLIEAGPASRAGVRRGDIVSRIEGASATEMTVSDAIQKLRGPAGSRVSMTLLREGATLDVTVVRERIER